MATESGKSAAVAAAAAALSELYSEPLPSPQVGVLRRPLDFSDDGRASPSEDKSKMSDISAGQYSALKVRVDGLKEDYERLSAETGRRFDATDRRFDSLNLEITRRADGTDERLDGLMTLMSSGYGKNNGGGNGDKKSGNGDGESRNSWILTAVITVAVAIIGGFIKYDHETITDKIVTTSNALSVTVTQQEKNLTDKILTLSSTTADNVRRIDAAIASMQRDTVPRAELDKTTGTNTSGVAELRRKMDDNTRVLANLTSDVAYIKSDVERFKTIAVSRNEIDGSKNDLINRINLLSNRITDSTKDYSALPLIIENQKQIRGAVDDLQRRIALGTRER